MDARGIRFGWLARALVLATLAISSALLISACGDGVSQLSTKLTTDTNVPIQPGDTPSYTVTVTNKGPGSATGVAVHVDLPAGFRFKSTTNLTGARTQPIDPPVNSPDPDWGLWAMDAPTETSNGGLTYDQVSVTFVVDAEGAPGTYDVTARSSGDSTQSDAVAPVLSVTVKSAAQLALLMTATPTNAHVNDLITYTITLTNNGTGDADDASLLITLPPGFAFSSTTNIGGTSSRSGGNNPAPNAAEVYYDGFTVPAKSDGGPGLLNVAFQARILRGAAAGKYPASCQVTDAAGDQVMVSNADPVTVQ